MKARARTARAVALLAAGAAAVHQLRYAIGYGHDADHALTAQGHAYLHLALPFVAALALVALGGMLRAPLTGGPGRPLSLRRAWAVAFVALVAIYCAQELLEGALASGHPAGLAGVFGGGAWLAVPLSAVVALLMALGLCGGEALAGAADPTHVQPLAGAAVVLPALGMRIAGAAPRRIRARGPPLLPIR